MEAYQVFLAAVFISSADSFKALDVPAVLVDTRPWPYSLYLKSVQVIIDEEFGSSQTYVRKDKSDKIRKLNGYVQLDKTIGCSVQGSMVAMIKSNNIWVENYRSLPKPFDAFVEDMKAPMDTLSAHTGMSKKCPVKPGNYTFDRFVMEPELFPRYIQTGDYVTTLTFTLGANEIVKYVISSSLDPII